MLRQFAILALVATQTLSQTILSDPRMNAVTALAHQLMRTGFSAGVGIYSPVFIRDYATFLPVSCDVRPAADLKARLIPFLALQDADGGISDAYQDTLPTALKTNPLEGVLDPKGTVESDQESALVQAISEYVACTGDRGFLDQRVGNTTVLQRLRAALNFVHAAKFDARYGLVTAGTTLDWGDVQAEDVPGGMLDVNSHLAISIYANAMYLIALNDFANLLPPASAERSAWLALHQTIAANTRRYLWDAAREKFIPHLYLSSSPFPKDFDENQILFEGGTAVAIQAGLLSADEIRAANAQMIEAQRASGAFSISGSVYPPYPLGYFKHPLLCEFCYQNGAVWPWFAARMVAQLAAHGMLRDAYDELQPMLDRTISDGDFFESYSPAGKPAGSPNFRGSAGAMALAIAALQSAARADGSNSPANFVNEVWSYANLPPGYGWTARKDAATSDTVYYGIAPSDPQPPLRSGDTVYVGPDSAFYYFHHPPPIAPADLAHRWFPLHAVPAM